MTLKQDLEIGQVIYILSDKSGNVIPAIVAEEVVIKTLEGNSISWKLFVGPETNRQVIDSRKITGDVYSTLDEVYRVLHERLTNFLDGTITETKQRAKKWYGVYVDESDKKSAVMSSITDESGKIDADQLLETVDKGTAETTTQPVTQRATSKRQKSPKEKLREAFGSDLSQPIEARQNTEQQQQTSQQEQQESLANVPIGGTIKRKQRVNGELVDVEYIRTTEGFEMVGL